MSLHRKLIEVALPLEAINRESAREKSIRHGHPSTLHLWWARRPLAACRAVLFAQLVDDPSAHPERFPDEDSQAIERQRLFDLIERMVVWENAGNEALMRQVHAEIAACFDGEPPAVLDPFCGGGSIPLEAQRLGLEAYGSDLNPVAVLITKALIEIPPKWVGNPPVFPDARSSRLEWPRATGLVEDIRRYGESVGEELERRIGQHYPKAKLADGTSAKVIAWVWARTVDCPNPACRARMPLVRSFWLSKKKDRPTWIRPVVAGKSVTFEVVVDDAGPKIEGTVGRQGAICLVCSTPVPLKYVRVEGQQGRMSQQLMAIIAEGNRQRLYLSPTDEQASAADVPRPVDLPEAELPHNPRDFKTPNYGMRTFADLFTHRQLVALCTLGEAIGGLRSRVEEDALAAGVSSPARYADAVLTYLGLAMGRSTDYNSSICTWHSGRDTIRNTFARQAIPMTWDFIEANLLGESTGNWLGQVRWVADALAGLPPSPRKASAEQRDAQQRPTAHALVSTDPPYYDNIGYADLSDFFYIWLRRALRDVHPELFDTMTTPKADELVATPYRFQGSKSKAEEHFEAGFVKTFTRIRETHPPDLPITVFYAFKQAEETESGTSSTGWETMLNGLIDAGLTVSATWPMRSEMSNRMLASGTNALASSIVLACRPRESAAEATTRRGFLQALKDELPSALREMQQGSIAPVDLAQAAIGPGMAVFTRYRNVIEADGAAMSVRTALALINHALDEVLAEQEGDFDPDTRFCVKWFSQFAWDEQPYGRAEELSRATNTSVEGLVRAGVFWARAGKARLLNVDDLPVSWSPAHDDRISVWEVVLHLAKALDQRGLDETTTLMTAAGQRVDLGTVKELAYLLFSICGKRGWTDSALLFNGLGTSWSDLVSASRSGAPERGRSSQDTFEFDSDEEL